MTLPLMDCTIISSSPPVTMATAILHASLNVRLQTLRMIPPMDSTSCNWFVAARITPLIPKHLSSVWPIPPWNKWTQVTMFEYSWGIMVSVSAIGWAVCAGNLTTTHLWLWASIVCLGSHDCSVPMTTASPFIITPNHLKVLEGFHKDSSNLIKSLSLWFNPWRACVTYT